MPVGVRHPRPFGPVQLEPSAGNAGLVRIGLRASISATSGGGAASTRWRMYATVSSPRMACRQTRQGTQVLLFVVARRHVDGHRVFCSGQGESYRRRWRGCRRGRGGGGLSSPEWGRRWLSQWPELTLTDVRPPAAALAGAHPGTSQRRIYGPARTPQARAWFPRGAGPAPAFRCHSSRYSVPSGPAKTSWVRVWLWSERTVTRYRPVSGTVRVARSRSSPSA